MGQALVGKLCGACSALWSNSWGPPPHCSNFRSCNIFDQNLRFFVELNVYKHLWLWHYQRCDIDISK